jgi:hypothetical protein
MSTLLIVLGLSLFFLPGHVADRGLPGVRRVLAGAARACHALAAMKDRVS